MSEAAASVYASVTSIKLHRKTSRCHRDAVFMACCCRQPGAMLVVAKGKIREESFRWRGHSQSECTVTVSMLW